MLTTNKDMMLAAEADRYGVGAFNISNLETLLAVSEAAVEEKSPAIVGLTPSAIKYGGLEYLAEIVKLAAKSIPQPMSLHLDHGRDVETVIKCISAGFTSVMIDASHLDFEQNVAVTKQVVDLAHPKGVSVEAELGRIAGIEETTEEERDAFMTDPDAVEDFVNRTGIDALAIAIGTAHGAYKYRGEPRLDFERLEAIRKKVDVLLVLHGASSVSPSIIEKARKYGAQLTGAKGIPEDHIKKAILLGISKINIDTDLRLAFSSTIREILATFPKEYDPRKILGPAREAVKEVVKSKMRIFGSSGKSPRKQARRYCSRTRESC